MWIADIAESGLVWAQVSDDLRQNNRDRLPLLTCSAWPSSSAFVVVSGDVESLVTRDNGPARLGPVIGAPWVAAFAVASALMRATGVTPR